MVSCDLPGFSLEPLFSGLPRHDVRAVGPCSCQNSGPGHRASTPGGDTDRFGKSLGMISAKDFGATRDCTMKLIPSGNLTVCY